MTDHNRRLRDPIHGLIVFDKNDRYETDMLAWRLIQTPEFQRLRRIRQLGVSEFVFPGATHTRFAHSIGVYHNARKLMQVVRDTEGADFKGDRARVVLIAALLHDLGHGPLSHGFEGARKALAQRRGGRPPEKHETFTARLVLDPEGGIRQVLDHLDPTLADDIARLIQAEDPSDIYHAVVSSSFDADRLDYLVRDRYMTGTGAGSIDDEWLIDNLGTYDLRECQDNDPEPRYVPTFVFKARGRQAAEDFLLSRYRLYTQVYLHRVTRGFEQMVSALLLRIAEAADEPGRLGLDEAHPLIRFLRPDSGETITDYRELDDAAVWAAVERLRRCDDGQARMLASRLWHREPLKALDISDSFGHDLEKLENVRKRLKRHTDEKLGKTVFRDEPNYSLYTRAAGEVTKPHKKVRVLTGEGAPWEITDFPDTVIDKKLCQPTRLTRYYFTSIEELETARNVMLGRSR